MTDVISDDFVLRGQYMQLRAIFNNSVKLSSRKSIFELYRRLSTEELNST